MAAASRQIVPAATQAGVYVVSEDRITPAPSAPTPAPIWCEATIHPNAMGASRTPTASVVNRTVGGTVAIQSRP